MLKQLEKARDQWGGHHSLIDRWLDDRQQLLVNYCGMFKQDTLGNAATLPDTIDLTHFCQQLVDYLSLGHFEVYESLVVESEEKRESSLKLAKELYPEITKTTDIAISFNDKYCNLENIQHYDVLSADLSDIGETLAIRIELEDVLINSFHKNH